MRTHRWIQALSLATVVLAGAVQAAAPPSGPSTALRASRQAATAAKIALAIPERVGVSSESLKELDAAMQGIVDKKQLSGVVTLLARHGQVVQHKAYGLQD